MIYAINKRTKEHVAHPDKRMSEVSDGVVIAEDGWELVEADAEGWIEWDESQGNPLPDGARCDVQVGGKTVPNVVAHDSLHWECVTHYRPILDAYSETEAPRTESNETAPEPRRPFIDAGRMMGMVRKSDAPEWDGETWPPPIGCELETFSSACDGLRAEVLAVRHGNVIGCSVETGVAGFLNKDECRPVRSEEDRAVDALSKAMKKASEDGIDILEDKACCRVVYQAIRDGKVPGVKLEDS